MWMQTSERVLIWVQNKAHTWFNVRDKAPMPPVAPTRLALIGLTDGEYNIELWDTMDGTIAERKSSTAADGRLTIDLPEVEHDIALKVK
jgi:hypothetical protein